MGDWGTIEGVERHNHGAALSEHHEALFHADSWAPDMLENDEGRNGVEGFVRKRDALGLPADEGDVLNIHFSEKLIPRLEMAP